MATLGDDIKNVYAEIGAEVAYIDRDGVDSFSGEYIDVTLNTQVTKPFIKEFFLECSFPYDTSGELGDIVQIIPSDKNYMLMNKTEDLFENAVVEYNTVMYGCNVSGELQRPSGEETWNAQTYRKELLFTSVRSNCYGLQTTPLFGNELDDDVGAILNIEKNELYLPTRYGAKPLDRYISASGEYYRIDNVKKRRYPSVDVFDISEDTR